MWSSILILFVLCGAISGCRSTPSSAPSNTSGKRTLSFSSEEELAEFLAANVSIGCDSATAKAQLETHVFKCDEIEVSGRQLLYCWCEEQESAFVAFTYVGELYLSDGHVTHIKAKIWGVGP